MREPNTSRKQERLATSRWSRNAIRDGVISYSMNTPISPDVTATSYISFRRAQTKGIKLVAYGWGNIPEMIQTSYQDFVAPEQADA